MRFIIFATTALLWACATVSAEAAREAAAMPPATGAPPSTVTATAVHDRLTRLAREITDTTARLFPIEATELGIPGHDGELDAPSEQARAAYLARLRGWQARLHEIAPAAATGLQRTDRDDAQLLEAQLLASLNGLLVHRVDRKDYSAGANNVIGAIFLQLQFLPVAGRDGATEADVDAAWGDLLARLGKAPAYIVAAQRLATEPGHLFGVVGSQELEGAASLFNGALTDAAQAHYGADTPQLKRFLQARDATLETIAGTRADIDSHVAQWPENYAIGQRAYEAMVRDEQLIPLGARAIERMARDELAHGWAEEAWLVAQSKHDGVSFGAPSGGGLAPGGSALIDFYRDRIAELGQFVRRHDIVTVPDWLGALSVQETPRFMQPVSPGASMIPPRPLSAQTSGYYFITPPTSLKDAAARLDMNQDFDRDRILSTAAHEAMPGHFLQLSIAKRHPDFIRRLQSSPEFTEGWAFYGEEMLVRLGLFGNDLDARLFTARWERVRGARAIVDIKLASGEWSYRQASDFYARESGFTREAAEAAVAGIATNPGYVIAYTVGRWQIQQLLATYLQRTGDQGSLRDFHDRLLSYGTTPLAIVGPELLADLDKPASAVRAAANY